MKKSIILLLMSSCLISCVNPENIEIKESTEVIKVAKSNHPKKGKFFVVTTSYCIFTNTPYRVGDTLYIKR